MEWEDALPRPVAFVLSGGATLGAMQVGMLQALGQVGLRPDLVVGASAGALNGALLAVSANTATAAATLEEIWLGLDRNDVFPGGRVRQAWRVLTRRSAFPNTALRSLIRRALPVTRFDELAVPFGALATDALTAHPHLFRAGRLEPALLASAAIPAVLPEVEIDGTPYWDGGVVSNVPLHAAVRFGAASIVVLDVGDVCHRPALPRGLPDTVAAALGVAIRQRVLVEAPAVAQQLPILYLPHPCTHLPDPLDFSQTAALIDGARDTAAAFLAEADVPAPGRMVGSPHTHVDPGAHEVALDTAS